MKNVIRVAYVAIVVVLIAATIADKVIGMGFASGKIYSSWWFSAMWAVLGIAGLAYMLRAKLARRPAVFLLHSSLILILIGAFTTHIFGEQGMMHIRKGQTAGIFYSESGEGHTLPFSVELREFKVVNYPGTDTPMDYVSHVVFTDNGKQVEAEISMNNIATQSGYRFYQSSYDHDSQGTVLSVSHDPAGIGITYAGYAMLFISLILILIWPSETFRRAISSLRAKAAAAVIVLTMHPSPTLAAGNNNNEISATTAAAYGNVYALYNGRICPLQTVARDFTIKIYGRDTYMTYTAEQVFLGWTLQAPQWTSRKMIRIKPAAARELGINSTLASYEELKSSPLTSKLAAIRHGEKNGAARALEEAEEKMSIVGMLFAGEMLKVFPLADTTGHLGWYSPADQLPDMTGDATTEFVHGIFGDAVSMLGSGRDADAAAIASKIRAFQLIATGAADGHASPYLPSDSRFEAEKMYNRLGVTRPLAMALTSIGILFFFVVAYLWGRGITSRAMRMFSTSLTIFLGIVGAYLLTMFVLRWYVGGHLPMSNGYETMQFMSLCVIAFTLIVTHRFALALPFGYLMAGLTMMVSMFGESNPQVTSLMPVLQSPLLSVHVCLVMIAYSLLAFMALNGLAAIVMRLVVRDADAREERIETLAEISRAILIPALACLAAGIFVGAIWANQSWGRYWGWDPKEVWALITMMVYAVPLHSSVVGGLRRPMALHVFLALAFLCVLMTYFGVNFLLGGMHSYAVNG